MAESTAEQGVEETAFDIATKAERRNRRLRIIVYVVVAGQILGSAIIVLLLLLPRVDRTANRVEQIGEQNHGLLVQQQALLNKQGDDIAGLLLDRQSLEADVAALQAQLGALNIEPVIGPTGSTGLRGATGPQGPPGPPGPPGKCVRPNGNPC